jgi:hypothetical protein
MTLEAKNNTLDRQGDMQEQFWQTKLEIGMVGT